MGQLVMSQTIKSDGWSWFIRSHWFMRKSSKKWCWAFFIVICDSLNYFNRLTVLIYLLIFEAFNKIICYFSMFRSIFNWNWLTKQAESLCTVQDSLLNNQHTWKWLESQFFVKHVSKTDFVTSHCSFVWGRIEQVDKHKKKRFSILFQYTWDNLLFCHSQLCNYHVNEMNEDRKEKEKKHFAFRMPYLYCWLVYRIADFWFSQCFHKVSINCGLHNTLNTDRFV